MDRIAIHIGEFGSRLYGVFLSAGKILEASLIEPAACRGRAPRGRQARNTRGPHARYLPCGSAGARGNSSLGCRGASPANFQGAPVEF
jgi:hypothetical protein